MRRNIVVFIAAFWPLLMVSQNTIELKIDSIFNTLCKVESSPGFSVCVIKDGKPILNRGYGLASLEYGIKNTDSSVFDVASMAKQFTAACIWVLVNKGDLSLEDDIRKYLPELPDWGDTIRIRHMLNHTSGLRNYATILELSGFNYEEHFFDNQSILELMRRQNGLNNEPGKKMLYGNTPYNLLTIIVERISGMSFKSFADQNLFIPLGMKNTTYRVDNSSIVKNRAEGYVLSEESVYKKYPRIESCYGAGSLWSTVDDLAKWAQLLLYPDQNYQSLADFLLTTVDSTNESAISTYARGLNLDDYKGYQTIHHSGMTRGYRSNMITIPEIELAVIILANFEAVNPVEITYQIVDFFVPNVEEELVITEKYNHSLSELPKYEGGFQELNSCLKMEIVLKNDTLFAKSSLGRNAVPLKSKSANSFCRMDDESVDYVFDQLNESDLLIYFGGTPFYFKRATWAKLSEINLDNYLGEYYSKELDVTYTIYKNGDELFLAYPRNPKIKLIAGQKDEFGNGYRTNYSFYRNENEMIEGFKVASEGIVKDIDFKLKVGN